MSFSVFQGIPSVFVIGDAASFQVSDSDHPAASWTASVYFKDVGGNVLPFARTSISGSDHVFALTNANTLTLIAGKNVVCVVFSDGTHTQTSDWSEVKVLDNPTAVSTPSFAQAQVTLLQGALAKFNGTTHQSVMFNGQSFSRANISTYRGELTYWQSVVRNEQEQAKANRGLPVLGRRIPFQPACP